ncbi:fumarylacetoacetate hydrolase family protein [Sphingomonas sp.]|uniref:fumarylacetoacetate hydrolase family protein n=1 Tax=Sphingomonas sp. TaxID=28214 RepID=UPI0026008CD1|nr:fumarylacetoacetate hydrolase family protein [Sphingomonas sp.]
MVPWSPHDVGEIVAIGKDGLRHCRQALDRISGLSGEAAAALLDDGITLAAEQARLASPVLRPGLIMLGGRSYFSHLEEMSKKYTQSASFAPPEPNAFNQSPNSVIGSGEPIILPLPSPDMVDYEAELAVVFGRRCHAVTEEEVRACIAGFTLMNDVSARDWNASAQTPSGAVDFTKIRLGKQFPTFCPVGPAMTTIDEFDDFGDIVFDCRVNSELVQSGSTADLVFSIERMISYYAQWHVFKPGDIFSMGTPAGVGHAREPSVFLKAGDVVEVSSPLIGRLRNVVERAPPQFSERRKLQCGS